MPDDVKYLYDVPVDGGKYRFRLDMQGHLDVLRHDEPWWTPTEGSKAIISLMDGEERRQNGIARINEALQHVDVGGSRALLESLRDILGG